jgi:GNAT superfamily N-acetyltransferase
MPDSSPRRPSAGWPQVSEPVAELLRAVVDGRPPPSNGAVTVVAQPPGPVAGVLAFDGHHVVAADVDPAWVHDRLPPGDLSAPLHPAFLGALAERLGRPWDNLDAVFVGSGEPGDVLVPLQEAVPDHAHPRVARAHAYRLDPSVYELPGGDGVLILGRGLSGRWEAAFEVAPPARGRGLGRGLVRSALRLVPLGEPVFVQVAPGNVSSTRAVLAAGGFVPIGAEVLYPDPIS